MHLKTATSIALLAALTLTGCSINTSNARPAGQDSEPSFAPKPTDDPEPEEVGNLAFGDAVTYQDGVSISVSAPAAFTPSEYAAGVDQANNVVFNITITNGSDANLDPFPYSQVSSGGVEASSIFDTSNNIGSYPTTVILPGGTITWSEAYSIADPASIIFQVSPSSFEYEDAIFTNNG